MKLRRARIKNFKGIRDLDLDLGDPPRRLTALLGENGSGKTTALQAIALVLSRATRQVLEFSDFRWNGFLLERVSSLGPTYVELEVDFDSDEVELTRGLAREDIDGVSPQGDRRVRIVYDNGNFYAPFGGAVESQFWGRYYLDRLTKVTPEYRELRPRLGGVFWFDQYRSIGSAKPKDGPQTWQNGVSQLREDMVVAWAAHSPNDTKDEIAVLEQRFATIFPGTRFRGVQRRGQGRGVDDSYFLIERDGKVFDFAEMSSGEQAIFAILYHFIRLDIGKSVVLIDELEMHLHPPQQQAVLRALPKLGPDCQFIFTTHSAYLEDAIPVEEQVRLGEPVLSR